jgi:hypothetical protein
MLVFVSNIEKNDDKMKCEDVNWILQSLDGIQWVILMNAVANIEKQRTCEQNELLLTSQERLCSTITIVKTT